MLDLNNYTTDQLYAMQDLLDHLRAHMYEYVTSDFMRITGIQDASDLITLEINERLEDMENEEE